MDAPLQFWLLVLGCAAALFAGGVALGWRLRASRRDSGLYEVDGKRIHSALTEIRQLADSLARDVGQHSVQVKQIANDLHGLEREARVDRPIVKTVSRILAASEHLQSQFEATQRQLEQQAAEIEAHAADARTDGLTGLANRRAFDDGLARCYAEWKRLQSPYSLFLLDLDRFKELNDRFGHQAGDEVLRRLGHVLSEAMREMDVVCRYGGEEFAVIMPATDGSVARRVAERARAAVEATRFRFDGMEVYTTASVGLAEILIGEDNAALFKRADEALYASKQAGRNKTYFHDGESLRPVAEDAAAYGVPALQAIDRLADSKGLHQVLALRVAESRRTKMPLALMLVELANYDDVVRQHGSGAGELLLDGVAQYLDVLVRDMDLLALIEPSRFAVMLPGSTLGDSLTVARRLSGALAASVIEFEKLQIRPAICLGLAEFTESDDAKSLLMRAESALAHSLSPDHPPAHLHDGQSSQPLKLAQAETASR